MKFLNAALVAALLVPSSTVFAQGPPNGGGSGGPGGGYGQPGWSIIVTHNFDALWQYGINGQWSDLFHWSTWQPYGVLGFGYPGGIFSATNTSYATAYWVNPDGSPASNPPIDANFLEIGSASWMGPLYATGTASNGLGSPDVPWFSNTQRGSSSYGKKLIKKHNAGSPIQFDSVDLAVSANVITPQPSNENSIINWGMIYSVINDPRSVGISRPGAIGEIISSNGDVHGDTVYTTDSTIRHEHFLGTLLGDWINPTHNWAGAAPVYIGGGMSADLEIDYSNFEFGTPKPASTKTVSFSSQDTDGASGVANYFLTQHDPWEKKSKTDLPAYVIKKRFPNTSGGNVFSFNVTDTPCTATITATSAVAAAATVTLTSSFKLGDIVTLGGSVATTVTMTITIGMASTTTLPPHSRAWPEGHFIYHDEEWITPHYISAGKDSEPTQRFTHSIDSGLGWSDCEPYDP